MQAREQSRHGAVMRCGVSPCLLSQSGRTARIVLIGLAYSLFLSAHLAWRIHDIIPLPLGRWADIIGIDAAFIVFAGLIPNTYRGLVSSGICSAGYEGLLFATEILRSGDAASVWRAFRRGLAGYELQPTVRRQPSPVEE